jgi:hypothetical protein
MLIAYSKTTHGQNCECEPTFILKLKAFRTDCISSLYGKTSQEVVHENVERSYVSCVLAVHYSSFVIQI